MNNNMFEINIVINALDEARSRKFDPSTFMDGNNILKGTLLDSESGNEFYFGIVAKAEVFSDISRRAEFLESYVVVADDIYEFSSTANSLENPEELFNTSNRDIIAQLVEKVTKELNESIIF